MYTYFKFTLKWMMAEYPLILTDSPQEDFCEYPHFKVIF